MESGLYGIFTLVGFVSEISLVRCAHSFDFRYFTNSGENPVRARFPWSNLYFFHHENIAYLKWPRDEISAVAVLMPTITKNPFMFLQEKIKETPLREWTSSLHYLSAVLPIARDGRLRRNTLINLGLESAFARLKMPFFSTMAHEYHDKSLNSILHN